MDVAAAANGVITVRLFTILYNDDISRNIVGLFFVLTSRSTIFQSFWDGAIASWVFTSTLGTLECLSQGHYTAVVWFEPRPLAPESKALPLSHRGFPGTFFEILLYILEFYI